MGEVKLALIPPFELLECTDETTCQLMLPQLAANPTYSYVYQRHCNDADQYVILDNGEAEGKHIDQNDLIKMAFWYGVDELVIPDVMGKMRRTIEKAQTFLAKYGDLKLKYMFVVQGKSYEEFAESAKWANRQKWIDTIGIPRHMIETCGGNPSSRVMLVSDVGIDKPVHLLGGSPLAPMELKYFDWPLNVRSTDTSAPFNYAHAHQLLRCGERVKRPKNYFEIRLEDFEEPTLSENLKDIMEWSGNDL